MVCPSELAVKNNDGGAPGDQPGLRYDNTRITGLFSVWLTVSGIRVQITFMRHLQRNGQGSTVLQPVSSNAEHRAIHIDGQRDFEISGVVTSSAVDTRRE